MFFSVLLPVTVVSMMSPQTALSFTAFPRACSVILRRLLESAIHNYQVSHRF